MARLTTRTIEELRTRKLAPVNVTSVIDNVSKKRTFVSTEQHTKITVDKLVERFCIGPLKAEETLKVTTQRGLRSAILPILRRYWADRMFGIKD